MCIFERMLKTFFAKLDVYFTRHAWLGFPVPVTAAAGSILATKGMVDKKSLLLFDGYNRLS